MVLWSRLALPVQRQRFECDLIVMPVDFARAEIRSIEEYLQPRRCLNIRVAPLVRCWRGRMMRLPGPLGHGCRNEYRDDRGRQADSKHRLHGRTIVAWRLRGRTASNDRPSACSLAMLAFPARQGSRA